MMDETEMDSIPNYELDVIVSKFIETVKHSSMEKVENMVVSADVKILVAALGIIESEVKKDNGEICQNMLYALISILRKDRPTEENQLLWNLKNILMFISQCRPFERTSLIKMGIIGILTSTMKREGEIQRNDFAWTENEGIAPSVHIISAFLPVISVSELQDIGVTFNDILYIGPDNAKRSDDEIKTVIDVTIPTLYNICQLPNCPTAYHLLMLKAIFWADEIKEFKNLFSIEDILQFSKMLLEKDPTNKDSTIIGFAILDILSFNHFMYLVHERVNDWIKEKFWLAFTWPEDPRYEWIQQMFSKFIAAWINQKFNYRARQDEKLMSQIKDIDHILDFIVPFINNENLSDYSINTCYKRLKEFIMGILNNPDLPRKGKVTICSEGITKFHNLVTKIVKTLDDIFINFNFLYQYSDLDDIKDLPTPKTPMDIELELCKSAAFDRVLGSSKSSEELRSNPFVRTLRLLSIFYEVNENWGVLFYCLTRETLIDRSCFVSKVAQCITNHQIKLKEPFDSAIVYYMIVLTSKHPFLLLLEHRRSLLHLHLNSIERPIKYYALSRNNIINNITTKYESLLETTYHVWHFNFLGEEGTGKGTTKEFYSEFSRDCQKFEKGLWAGEPSEAVDGVFYVNHQSGLFPLPSSGPSANTTLKVIGLFMAKSLLDDYRMDINFSNAFYKCLFKKNLEAQQLSLIDINDVMPSIFKFVESLGDALREKWFIENDKSMTTEEQNQAIANITCGGCSFEDLCVNFTLPGYPEIEMMESGSETILDIHNIEKYLKLVVWWLLYKNPQQNIKLISSGFEQVLNKDDMKYFYPHEYEKLLCGLAKEHWTVKYLEKNCVLHGEFTLETPVIQYLLEVLASLSTEDQRNFLQFVTSAPRLPVGGLANLRPKLGVKPNKAIGNPDSYLPSSNTCYNMLLITEYSSKNILEEKLLWAIREGTGFFHFE